ncbi:MAG: nucleotidyltransferase family protein [Bermanella sp.]
MKNNLDVNSKVNLTKLLAEIVLPITQEFSHNNLKQCDKFKLIEVANKNYMNFALYQGLVKNDLLSYFTAEQTEYLKEFYELNEQRNTGFLSELRGIILELNKYDIEPVLLKGAVALVDNWYAGMGARFMRDIDFLVPEHQVDIAYKILKDMGYQEVHEEDGHDHDFHHHCPALQKPDSALVIEVHSKPLSIKTKGVLTSKEVFKHKCQVTRLDIGNCYIPSPAHCLMIAILHTEISHGNRGKGVFFLRHAMDVAIILAHYKQIDFYSVESALNLYGFKSILSSYLFVLNHFFKVQNKQDFTLYMQRNEEYLSTVLNNMSQESSAKRFAFDFYKKVTIGSFSRESISSRYGAKSTASIYYFRLINLARLLVKYSVKSNWDIKNKIIESETSVVRLIGEK